METLLSLAGLLAGVGSGLLCLETLTSVRSDGKRQVWEERLHWGVNVLAVLRGDVILVAFTVPLSLYFLARRKAKEEQGKWRLYYYSVLTVWQVFA